MKKFGVHVAAAGPGPLQVHLSLPGEVVINADRVAHIIPRVPGVVREVRKNLGETVKKDEIVGVLDSRELADAKAAFLAARERVALEHAQAGSQSFDDLLPVQTFDQSHGSSAKRRVHGMTT